MRPLFQSLPTYILHVTLELAHVRHMRTGMRNSNTFTCATTRSANTLEYTAGHQPSRISTRTSNLTDVCLPLCALCAVLATCAAAGMHHANIPITRTNTAETDFSTQ